MKKYVVKINGKEYDVEVTEVGGVSQAPALSVPVLVAPAPISVPKAEQKQEAPKPQAAAPVAGCTTVNAPMPGSIVRINVTAGTQVKKGDVLLVLEAMKMENEIVSPQDGIIASVNVSVGNAVSKGEIMISLS